MPGASPDLLAAGVPLEPVLERLPPIEQCLTVARLGREWRDWATPRRERLREAQRQLEREVRACPPLWALREAWPGLTRQQKDAAAARAARGGAGPLLQFMLCDGGYDSHGRPALCAAAAAGGHLAALQLAWQLGCPWDIWTCRFAAAGGHLAVLQWARQHGCPWDELTASYAAYGDHLAVLRWARQHGCPWDNYTCREAARGGHLAVLQWARQEGCPWNERTCTAAATGGHLAVLQWARQHGCPWDDGTCRAAATGGHLAVLQWARQEGCPWDRETCMLIAQRHEHVLAWIRAQPE
jgi:hypothetical protein